MEKKRENGIEVELKYLQLKKSQLEQLNQTDGVKKQIKKLNVKIEICKKEL